MKKITFTKILPYLLCFLFFIAYSTLSLVRHNHYESFGFDLGINDQVVWHYSRFEEPISTIDHAVFSSKLDIHIEIIYALLAPFYWIWSDPRMLLLLQTVIVCFSGLAVYFLAKHYKLHPWLQIAMLLSFLLWYGIQNALWFDVHSAPFATAFTAWFIYFLVSQKHKWAILFFLLAITGKENIAGITFLISAVYFITTKNKSGIYFAGASLLYLLFAFGIYFPHFVQGGYKFASSDGMLSKIDPRLLFNTPEKLQVYFYSLLSSGFLPLLNPLYLIPALGNLATYFILGTKVTGAQGLFLHYRVELAPLMIWATIATIVKFKQLNTKKVAVYLIVCIFLTQYLLHLPLSYLTKKWFWTETLAVNNINTVLKSLPPDAAVVAQDNIIPHISHRKNIFVLWPETKTFQKNSPCGDQTCNWFRWVDSPQYLVVDTSNHWNILHLTQNRDVFLRALTNIEKAGVITKYKQADTAVLYKVNKNPESVK